MSSKPIVKKTTYVPAIENETGVEAVKENGKQVEFHRVDALKRYLKKNKLKYYFKDVRNVSLNKVK